MQDQKFGMIVDEDYMNELLKYDFTSTKKGRGYSSLLVQKKIKNKLQGPQVNNGDISE